MVCKTLAFLKPVRAKPALIGGKFEAISLIIGHSSQRGEVFRHLGPASSNMVVPEVMQLVHRGVHWDHTGVEHLLAGCHDRYTAQHVEKAAIPAILWWFANFTYAITAEGQLMNILCQGLLNNVIIGPCHNLVPPAHSAFKP